MGGIVGAGPGAGASLVDGMYDTRGFYEQDGMGNCGRRAVRLERTRWCCSCSGGGRSWGSGGYGGAGSSFTYYLARVYVIGHHIGKPRAVVYLRMTSVLLAQYGADGSSGTGDRK